jgi:hypothetical protein
MIDIGNEELIPIRQVPSKLPARANGKQVHVTTVYRWINNGVRGVKLESLKVGGTTYTSAEALQRFAEALSHPAALSTPPYSLARQREIERAAREVAEIFGIRS